MNTDFVKMVGNISQSLLPVQALVSGLGYLIGIVFFIVAIAKFKKIGEHGRGGSHERMFVPLAYMLAGAALVFLPSTLNVLSNTAFGLGNVLQYTQYNPYNIYSAMKVIIQTAGLIWFVRGCVLLAHASEPGVKGGLKGFLFLFAGILAMNFDYTAAMLNYILNHLMAWAS